MATEHQNPDGSYSPEMSMGWLGGIDFEIFGTGPYAWLAYDEDVLVGRGKARTRIGLAFALRRAERRLRR